MTEMDTQKLPAAAPEKLLEFSDEDYWRDVLQLESHRTEDAMDQDILHEASILGVEIAPLQKGHVSLCDSSVTVESRHARTGSTDSRASISTGATSRSSNEGHRRHNRGSSSFNDYDLFLEQQETLPYINAPTEPAPSLFSVSTRKSYSSIKNGIKNRFKLRRAKTPSTENLRACICCREEYKGISDLHVLPCLHKYCDKCLRVLIQQATTSEDKFPPKCCSRGISGSVVQSVLTAPEQSIFISAVQQYSTPWAARIYCPNSSCGAFVPPRPNGKVDPKNPFTVPCRVCTTAICSICKREAHEIGQDCPSDWELDAVLKMGEKSGWRRCYKCRTLVELGSGCSHITCRCKAQFCYICGAVWDEKIGCPNYCSGEEELERRREEEAERERQLAEEKARKEEEDARAAVVLEEARKRTAASRDFQDLLVEQIDERDRFISFERKMKWVMWTRHGQVKLDVLDKYGELQAKMREKHAKTSAHLEDRQLNAEMELRASLKQAERSVHIRLRHMEAYCDGLGRGASVGGRVVTERDLRELGQQYNIRDDLERLHAAKINVIREKQAKQMEQLLIRQEEENERLREKQETELDTLEEAFALEESKFIELFLVRKERLRHRWKSIADVERKKLGARDHVEYGPLDEVEWPLATVREEGLINVIEEDD